MIKSILFFLISIITTYSISIIHDIVEEVFYYNVNSYLYIICIGAIYYLLKKNSEIKDKRLIKYGIIVGIIYATIYIIGDSLNSGFDFSKIFISEISLKKAILKWFGHAVIVSNTIIFLYNLLNQKEDVNKKYKINKKTFFIIWILIFLAYLPYFLHWYPGKVISDSVTSIREGLGEIAIDNRQPILLTFLFKIFMTKSNEYGCYNTNIASYIIFQMLYISGIFSASVYYLIKREMPKNFVMISLLYYMFYPVHGLFSVTLFKDVLFSGAINLFIIGIYDISVNSYEIFRSKRKMFIFLLSILIVIFTRNNGIYAIACSIPFIIYFCKRTERKKIITIFIISFIICLIIWGILYGICGFGKAEKRESIAVVMQQLGKIVKEKKNELTDDEMNTIHKFFFIDDIGENYDPVRSDPIKDMFNEEYYINNMKEFYTVWVKLFFRYPCEYLEAFLCESYGYWYSGIVQEQLDDEKAISLGDGKSERFNFYQKPIIYSKLIEKNSSLIENATARDFPIIFMLCNIGFWFWIVIIAMLYILYKKKYNLILIYLPVLFIWLTLIVGPKSTELRYIYCMFTSLPLTLSTVIASKKVLNKEK